MAVLTVGSGQAYTTIAAAVAASSSGDTINVMAGTYTNDFVGIYHNLTVQGIGGPVNLVATTSPPNGKAIIDEGGSGVSVTLSGLTLSGAIVADNNGAGVRYEGGTLTMTNDTVTGNQEGLLANADPNGVITISNSTFNGNGAGDGYSHNIYAGAVAQLTVQNSTIENSAVGHDIKSRAAATTITGNTIIDTAGTGSYEIDLPNGGNAVISNNVIEKGAHAQNPNAIAYGEEGNLHPGTLSVTNNLIVNDFTGHSTNAVWNATGTAATVSGNTFYGWSTLTSGPANTSSNTVATTEPTLTPPNTGATGGSSGGGSGGGTGGGSGGGSPATSGATTLGSGPNRIVLNVSEDAWQGNAQFTVSVDGQQVGGTQTATALHGNGQTQEFDILGAFAAGTHQVGVTFLNDAYGGTSATDRNLYVDKLVDGSATMPGANLYSNGTAAFTVGTPAQASSAPTLGTGPDHITLNVSEDAWKSDAQFTVFVDGQQLGGVQTATASHAAGQTQAFTLQGNFGTAQHAVSVAFLNDAYGGTSATDRNLYVDGLVDGTTTTAGSPLYSNGALSFLVGTPAAPGGGSPATSGATTLGSGPNRIVLNVSEDAWQGNAQFTVSVDGQQVGGTQTATALHGNGQTQEFDILGAFAAGTHQVGVTFLNDAYGGTSATDRNLYVDKLGSATVNTPLYSAGTHTFTTVLPGS